MNRSFISLHEPLRIDTRSVLSQTIPPYPPDVDVYVLSFSEREEIEELLGRTMRHFQSVEDPVFLMEAPSLAYQLPPKVVRFLERFKRTESAAAVVVKGFAVDDARIGLTPTHWAAQGDKYSTLREEMYFVLMGTLLGEIFGWSTLQNGHLVHNVVPIRGDEDQQSGHGTTLLEWHTEDGFHPYRCDYLGLMVLRNHEHVPTTFASIQTASLTDEERCILGEPRFLIRPDLEHVRGARRVDRPAWMKPYLPDMQEMWENPVPTAVLFGDPRNPYLRIDPFFMDAIPGDALAERALKTIVEQLEAALADFLLLPGDVGIIDNYQAVHGRRAFKARYDGTDRWLKKIVVSRDLRKSRAARATAESRIVL